MNRHAFCISIYNKVFKFRKWFMYGLKAQKLLAPFRACGAKLAKVQFHIRNRFRIIF